MSTTIGIGFSQSPYAVEAADEASRQALKGLNSLGADLCVIFATSHFASPKIPETVSHILQPKHLVGTCSNSVILPEGIFHHGIIVLAMSSRDIHCGTSGVINLNISNMRQAGYELAKKSSFDLHSAQRQAGLIFSDHIFQESDPFIQGAHEAWGTGFPMAGVIGNSVSREGRNAVFFKKQTLSNTAVSLLLAGNISVALGGRHGFKPLGKPRTVTHATGQVIHTIDGKPASQIYEHYLPGQTLELKDQFIHSLAMLYPLGIFIESEKQYLLRNPVDILNDGSIVCQGEVPAGSEIHLMISSKDACRKTSLEAAREARNALGDKQPKLVLMFESEVRRKIIGRDTRSEITSILEVLGSDTPMMGMSFSAALAPFKSFSELRPVLMHNEYIMIVAIG